MKTNMISVYPIHFHGSRQANLERGRSISKERDSGVKVSKWKKGMGGVGAGGYISS
jgi:hypothetical protein